MLVKETFIGELFYLYFLGAANIFRLAACKDAFDNGKYQGSIGNIMISIDLEGIPSEFFIDRPRFWTGKYFFLLFLNCYQGTYSFVSQSILFRLQKLHKIQAHMKALFWVLLYSVLRYTSHAHFFLFGRHRV